MTDPYPKVGDPAPDFCLPSTEGRDICLSEFRGQRNVVLYFYPKDDTPGCTAEACDFRDSQAEYRAHGAVVLGVSPDPLPSHLKFREKYGLPFPLLSDTDHRVAEQYGVWQLKSFAGRQYMGVVRTTFVIAKDGTIAAVFPNVKVAGHAGEVLAALGR